MILNCRWRVGPFSDHKIEIFHQNGSFANINTSTGVFRHSPVTSFSVCVCVLCRHLKMHVCVAVCRLCHNKLTDQSALVFFFVKQVLQYPLNVTLKFCMLAPSGVRLCISLSKDRKYFNLAFSVSMGILRRQCWLGHI